MKPVFFQWDGEAMVPLQRFTKLCDEQFVIGENYKMEPVEERSQASHSHYFAELTECWKNLREHDAPRFPTFEHFRAWCLIRTGWCSETKHVAESREAALRIAALVQPLDPLAVVVVTENIVTIYRARSQSKKEMNKEDFQQSKDAVLALAASMIGVKPEVVKREAGRAA